VKKFHEIDSVFLMNDEYWLVEVKVSSSSKSVTKASKQLIRNSSILKRNNIDVQLLIIHIDLLATKIESKLDAFKENFSETNFSGNNLENSKCHYLKLSPEDIFRWGVDNGFIRSENLLELAINEAEELNQKRKKRAELKELNIPKDEWSEDVQIEEDIDDGVYVLNDSSDIKNNPLAELLQKALLKTS